MNKIAGTGAAALLMISFLLLVSREIKFDEFDLRGDSLGKRSTVPMVVSSKVLNVLHVIIGVASLCLLLSTVAMAGKFSWQTNLLLGSVTSVFAAALMLIAYQGRSKEKFYKVTRLLMLGIPISIFVSM